MDRGWAKGCRLLPARALGPRRAHPGARAVRTDCFSPLRAGSWLSRDPGRRLGTPALRWKGRVGTGEGFQAAGRGRPEAQGKRAPCAEGRWDRRGRLPFGVEAQKRRGAAAGAPDVHAPGVTATRARTVRRTGAGGRRPSTPRRRPPLVSGEGSAATRRARRPSRGRRLGRGARNGTLGFLLLLPGHRRRFRRRRPARGPTSRQLPSHRLGSPRRGCYRLERRGSGGGGRGIAVADFVSAASAGWARG